MESKADGSGAGAGAGDDTPPPSYRRLAAAAEREPELGAGSSRAIPRGAVLASGAGDAGSAAFGDVPPVHRSAVGTLPVVSGGAAGFAPSEKVFTLPDDVWRAAIAPDAAIAPPAVGAAVKPGVHSAAIPAAIFPPTLPQAPIPLDPSIASVRDVPAVGLVAAIKLALASKACDFNFDADKCKFKVCAFHNGASTALRVFLYTVSEDEVAVEFQKRSGDSHLYRQLRTHVATSISETFKGHFTADFKRDDSQVFQQPFPVVLPAAACDFSKIKTPKPLEASLFESRTETAAAPAPAAATDPPAVAALDPEKDAAADSMHVITALLEASDERTVSQGVRAAAVASAHDSMRDAMVNAGVIDAVAAALARDGLNSEVHAGGFVKAAGDVDTRCFAATTLANLSQSRECQEQIVDCGVLRTLFRVTSTGHDFESAQLRRECVRAVANLSATQGKTITSSGGLDAVKGLLRGCDDQVMRTHALRAQQALEA